jgi:hypothetical protein
VSNRLIRRVVAKTASATINPNADDPGTLFTNDGASGAVALTLPAPSLRTLGFWYEFAGVADQDISFVAPTADTAIALNDVAADSLAASTSGQKIGALLRAVCVRNGTSYKWLLQTLANGATGTVAT